MHKELMRLMQNAGATLKDALVNTDYQQKLKSVSAEAKKLGINAIPAFVFENGSVFTGALTPDAFRNASEQAQKSL